MSGMEDRVSAKLEKSLLDTRYAAARAELERSRLKQDRNTGLLLFAAMAYGDALESNSVFRKLSHGAQLFCIAAAFVIPNLLVIHLLL